jgi:adenosylcobinamide-phosphate synthase
VPRGYPLAFGLLAGSALDAVLPDPRRGHPVAVFGAAAASLEQRLYGDNRLRGVLFTALGVGAAAALGAIAERRAGRFRFAAVTAATWCVLGARSLRVEGRAVHDLLVAEDLPAARRQVTHLVGRDPSRLDADGIARAALESVAENTCDAIVAPLFWGALAGIPGLFAYRAANTLDAMVGHRSPRYERFGWASARLDDVANLVPARLTAGLVALAAPVAGGDPLRSAQVAVRDGHRLPSPNSGYSEAAYAGALGVRLGGRNVYAGRVEVRPTMGSGRSPQASDLGRATRLCAAVTIVAAAVAAAVAVAGRAVTGVPGVPAVVGARR